MLLIRVDPEAHMNRWYLVMVQPSLVDPVAVVCAWGSRQSSHQRLIVIPAESQAAAEALAEKIIRKKLKRGYVPA